MTNRNQLVKKLNESGEKVAAVMMAMMPTSADPYKLLDFQGEGRLISSFIFNKSPQGGKYWFDLRDKYKEL